MVKCETYKYLYEKLDFTFKWNEFDTRADQQTQRRVAIITRIHQRKAHFCTHLDIVTELSSSVVNSSKRHIN